MYFFAEYNIENSQIILNITDLLIETIIKSGTQLEDSALDRLIEQHQDVEYLPDKSRIWVKINNK